MYSFFPSNEDTFGLVNVESMSCGTPVAAYCGNCTEDFVIEGVNGSLNEDLRTACFNAIKKSRDTN